MKQCLDCKLGYDGHGGRRCSLDRNLTEYKKKCIAADKMNELIQEINRIAKIKGLKYVEDKC